MKNASDEGSLHIANFRQSWTGVFHKARSNPGASASAKCPFVCMMQHQLFGTCEEVGEDHSDGIRPLVCASYLGAKHRCGIASQAEPGFAGA